MVQKFLLNSQTIWIIFTKILKNTIEIKNQKLLAVFDDIIADMLSNKKLNPIVNELFIRGRKIFQSYFAVPKNIRLNSTHTFVMKILNKRELQQIASIHSSDIYPKDFMNFCKKSTAKHCSFLVIGSTLASDNLLRFRKDLLERM